VVPWKKRMEEERVWQRGRERGGRKEDLFRGNSTADGCVFFFFFFSVFFMSL
jgi:hypothetical protein